MGPGSLLNDLRTEPFNVTCLNLTSVTELLFDAVDNRHTSGNTSSAFMKCPKALAIISEGAAAFTPLHMSNQSQLHVVVRRWMGVTSEALYWYWGSAIMIPSQKITMSQVSTWRVVGWGKLTIDSSFLFDSDKNEKQGQGSVCLNKIWGGEFSVAVSDILRISRASQSKRSPPLLSLTLPLSPPNVREVIRWQSPCCYLCSTS